MSEIKKAMATAKEMVDFYKKRTKEHIDRVAKNINRIANLPELDSGVMTQRALIHDGSKYSTQERVPYIWLTEFYRCKNEKIPFKYPLGVEEKVDKASEHHVKTNRHHPESHASPLDMSKEDIAEMVCDHCAMSQELNNSLSEWEKNDTLKKYSFSDEQTELIWKLVNMLERRP